MRSLQFQKTTKSILPFAVLCGILLVFTYAFPLNYSDHLLSLKIDGTGWSSYLAESTGNYGTELLSVLFYSHSLVRHILTACLLSLCVITLIRYSGAGKNYLYFLTLALVLVAPNRIFAETFTWAEGAAASLLPTFLLLLYLFSACDLYRYKGKKKTWKIPFLFLCGLLTQFFDESLAIAALILSLVLLVLQLKKYGLSLHMAAHSFGALLGLILNLIISGTRQCFAENFYVILDQLSAAVDALFVYNWVTVGALTLACLLLIQPVRSERSKNCNRSLFLLLGSVGLFLMFRISNPYLEPFAAIGRYSVFVKLIAAGAYLWAVLRVLQHYVSKDYVVARVKNNVIAVAVFVLTFACTNSGRENLLYLPFLAMVSCAVSLFVYVIRRYPRLETSMKKTFLLAGILVSLLMCWISVSNAMTVGIMKTHVEESMDEDAKEITLPGLPYADYGSGDMMTDSVYELEGDRTVSFVPYDLWDWAGYYEAHNVPIIEEYEEPSFTEDETLMEDF